MSSPRNVLETIQSHFSKKIIPTEAELEAAYSHSNDLTLTDDSKFKQTALHIAARTGVVNIVEWILNKNSSLIDVENAFGSTPLNDAASFGQLEVCRLLIAKGANVNKPGFENRTALHSVIGCAKSSKVKENLVLLLLENKADFNAIESTKNYTPLHMAVRFNFGFAIEMLLNYGADITKKCMNHLTAEMLAHKNGYKDFEKLLKFYRQKNSIFKPFTASVKPIVDQICDAKTEVPEQELEKAYLQFPFLNLLNKHRKLALYEALLKGFKKTAHWLIKKGAVVNTKCLDELSLSILSLASVHSDFEMCTLILENGFNVNDSIYKGRTPLHCAFIFGNDCNSDEEIRVFDLKVLPIAELLIKHKVNVNQVEDKTLLSALHLATAMGLFECVKLLMGNGADILQKDAKLRTALDYAKKSEIRDFLANYKPVVKEKSIEAKPVVVKQEPIEVKSVAQETVTVVPVAVVTEPVVYTAVSVVECAPTSFIDFEPIPERKLPEIKAAPEFFSYDLIVFLNEFHAVADFDSMDQLMSVASNMDSAAGQVALCYLKDLADVKKNSYAMICLAELAFAADEFSVAFDYYEKFTESFSRSIQFTDLFLLRRRVIDKLDAMEQRVKPELGGKIERLINRFYDLIEMHRKQRSCFFGDSGHSSFSQKRESIGLKVI